jgi:hypothetical protein
MFGNPTNPEVFPQVLEDAVYAWNTGYFEGQDVFQAEDPGRLIPDQDHKANGLETDPANLPRVT